MSAEGVDERMVNVHDYYYYNIINSSNNNDNNNGNLAPVLLNAERTDHVKSDQVLQDV